MSESTEQRFQVSPRQEQLWLESPDGPPGRVQAVVSLAGPIDEPELRRALDAAVARHEILRTTFVRQPGIRVPLQVVLDELAPAWEAVDLAALPGDDRDARIAAVCSRELEARLDFGAGPLLRVVLVAGAEAERTLVLTLSSLCADAASIGILIRELAHGLTGEGTLVEGPLQYADFAAWQLELTGAEEPEAVEAREFWRGLEDVSAPTLPFARSAPAPPLASERVPVALSAPLADALSVAAGRYGATLESFVHAAWCAVLARSASTEETVVAFVGTARRHADLEGAIGALSRSVPLQVAVPQAITFAELVHGLDRARAGAAVWQDYGEAIGFTTGFLAAEGVSLRAGDLSVTLERILDTGRGLALALACITGEGDARLELCFDSAWHDRGSVERLARRLERALEAAATDPGQAVAEIDLLDGSERRRVLVEFNDTAAPETPGTVHERFERHVAQSPSRAAVLDEHGSLTYAELDARANQLANRLRATGVGPGTAVGLCTDRSREMVVGLLGILKAGGAYVPLHYEHPPARLGRQLATAGARAVVTQEALLEHLPEVEGEVICLDRDRAAIDGESPSAPEVSIAGDELAYVIYTSGSTGVPKGVGVTHANVVNYATFIAARLGADEEPLAFGVVTSISTDLGNTSVFGALCSGGTLVLISPVVAADSAALAAQLDASPIDVLKITPSHAGALLAGRDRRVLPARWLVIGGERAPWDLVDRVRALSEVSILNHYGPTEATIGCCTFEVPDGPGEWAPASVPIGRPIANDRCYVLDDRRAPVPLGAPGRLFIGGAGVARGYVGAPELTSERFLEDPFAGSAGARMYDTGDVARWLPDGTLEFLGRVDEQVKIRGYRVEPAEVESALRSHERVREAVVVARAAAAGDIRLVAYCATGGEAPADELKGHLAQWLPEFMIPSVIVCLDALPVTPSGKIDRLALPDPDELEDAGAAYVAPRTPVEQALAEIWSNVLRAERIGVEDDFFALGGHSLLATQVVAEVRSDFAVDLPLHSLFMFPTVASLAAEVVRMMSDSEGQQTVSLLAELEGLSDQEAERLLAGEGHLPEAE